MTMPTHWPCGLKRSGGPFLAAYLPLAMAAAANPPAQPPKRRGGTRPNSQFVKLAGTRYVNSRGHRQPEPGPTSNITIVKTVGMSQKAAI